MILQLITIFVICYAFTKSGAAEVIIRWILSRKIFLGRPYLLTMALVTGLSILGIVAGQFALILILASLLKNICTIADMDVKGDWPRSVIIFMTVVTGSTGSLLYYMAFPTMIISMFDSSLSTIGTSISPATYMLTVFLISLFQIVLFGLYIKIFGRFDLKKLAQCDVKDLQPDEFKRMNKEQVIITVTLIVSLLFPFLIRILPEDSSLYAMLDGMGLPLFICIAIGFLCIVRVNKKPLLNVREALSQGVSWDVIFATASVLLISGGLSSDEAGFTAWILEVCSDFMTNVGAIPVIILVSAITTILTQFFSNTATGVIMATILAPLSIVFYQNGYNVSVFPAIIICCCLAACLIPAGSSQSALMLGTEIFDNDIGWTLKKGWAFVIIVILAASLSGILISLLG